MLEESGKYYLYRHIRVDKKEPFYIGIGTKKDRNHYRIESEYERAYIKNKRNSVWQNIVNKTKYEVEILIESDDYNFIKEKEVEFIALYKRKDCCGGVLSNLTDGGDGSVNREPWNKGIEMWGKLRPHPYLGKTLSEETKAKKSESMKKSDKNLKGKKLPKWWKEKISAAVRGENNHRYGKTGAESANSKRVINIETKEVFESITEASATTEYSMKYVAGMLNQDKNNLTPLVFEEVYKVKGLEYCKSITNMQPKPVGGNSKKVKDTETGGIYDSAKELAEVIGKDPAILRKQIREGKSKYQYI